MIKHKKFMETTYDEKYQKMLKNVDKLIYCNNHTEALIVIAKFFGLNYQLGQLQSIRAEHERRGSMTMELTEKRSAITKQMMNLIVMKCQSEEIMKEVYSKL